MLNPSIVVKGGEWIAEQVRQQDNIPPEIEVKIFPIIKGYSSHQIIQHIRDGEPAHADS